MGLFIHLDEASGCPSFLTSVHPVFFYLPHTSSLKPMWSPRDNLEFPLCLCAFIPNTIIENTLFQDNKSAIILETKGKTTNSGHTKHIKVCYFFITDKVSNKEVTIDNCPTEQMWADILTKPLQGAKFREVTIGNMNIQQSTLGTCIH